MSADPLVIQITLDTVQRYADLIERCKPTIVVTEDLILDNRPGLRSSFVTQNQVQLQLSGTVLVTFQCTAEVELRAEHSAKIRESADKVGAFTATGRISVLSLPGHARMTLDPSAVIR